MTDPLRTLESYGLGFLALIGFFVCCALYKHHTEKGWRAPQHVESACDEAEDDQGSDTVDDYVLPNGSLDGDRVVSGYRMLADSGFSTASKDMFDEDIIMIYICVSHRFQLAAADRNTQLPREVINRIVLVFLQKFQMFGEDTYVSNLEYEVNRFLEQGLREEYTEPLFLPRP